ncbi:hypothetical protein HELRODRAFT_79067, partial [Helobdella robusta]|uniref:Cadherin domain-containing protein n=1 Tax=Helobdella robusta TaxID=6412 RepID=T1G3J8_HELRO
MHNNSHNSNYNSSHSNNHSSHSSHSSNGYHYLEYTLIEEQPTNTYIGNIITNRNLTSTLTQSDLDQLEITFFTKPEAEMQFFDLDRKSGKLSTNRRVDREQVCPGLVSCLLQFDVSVRPLRLFQIQIEILDINDNVPVFEESPIMKSISESADLDTVLKVKPAVDLDSSSSSSNNNNHNNNNPFELVVEERADGRSDVKLKLRSKLDRENVDVYKLIIYAMDGGHQTGSCVIDIVVLDTNDNSPIFEKATYDVIVPENAQIGTTIITVRANDRDQGLNSLVHYSLSYQFHSESSIYFGVKPQSGKIFLKSNLDYETKKVHIFTVTATDRGSNPLPAHASVVVRVQNVNDNKPEISVRTMTS